MSVYHIPICCTGGDDGTKLSSVSFVWFMVISWHVVSVFDCLIII